MELIGRRFGHIRVTEVVGQGGMGDVYAGYDEKLERKVALKVLNSDQRLDDEARERLLREARALSKLEHPNICRIHDYIETGDVDLLVLEYIDGRTLHDALSEKTPRSEKLRIAAAIAEVMVKAHRAGIVHRDLKPENVMLTRSGEVKVLDFGLARWLNRAKRQSSDRLSALRVPVKSAAEGAGVPADTLILPPPSPTPLPSGTDRFNSDGVRREFLATAVGITLGTPIFMSPEQARGESLTPASDMFSFGLLLQTLFTGEDPHPMGLTAREVILRVARGETLPVQGAPGDVTALINRLKQFAPADRPTALEALERLRMMEEKPQRIARRAIVGALALIALLGAWRYTVDLKAERALAVAARAEADARRGQAEDLIEFMIGDLRKKLEPVGRLDILDDVGKRAIEYVDSLGPEKMGPDELVRNTKALNQLGEVRVGQGKTTEALEMFRRSLAFADEAVRRDARNAQAQLVLGATHFWIGNTLRIQGDTAGALQHMRDYMRAGDALVRIDPANDEHQLERAYGHSGVALILDAQGKPDEALEHYRVSLEIKQKLAERDRRDANAQAELARALNKVGAVLYKKGDLRGALEHSRREVEIYRALVQREPKQERWKQRLATSMAYLGRALHDTGDSVAALSLLHEELAIERQLMTLDPTNVESQRAVAMTLRSIAEAQMQRGDTEAARALYEESRTLIANTIARAPTYSLFVVDAANVDIDYGYLLAKGGDARGLELIRDARRKLEPLRADPQAQSGLARAAFMLGEALAATGRRGADAEWARAERELEPLVAMSPSPTTIALWFEILTRRNRAADARLVLQRLQRSGYATTELERLCTDRGC
jgi:eukaryotic-like serine/threonine-protein kinase